MTLNTVLFDDDDGTKKQPTKKVTTGRKIIWQ
jgi:hypothetical protein